MKNHTPAGRGPRFATAGQRAFTLLLVVVFFSLVWVARSGRYDREINRAANWLDGKYDKVVKFSRDPAHKR